MTYSLSTSYTGHALLDGFAFFHGRDPSNGFVAYQPRAAAEAADLFSVDRATGAVRLGVDHTNVVVTGGGRPSLRLESRAEFDHGLFIADFGHVPPSLCGVWPAFWAYGPDWPSNGEIDIIEGANTAQRSIMSAHTSPGCIISSPTNTTGTLQEPNCGPHDFNVGCTYSAPAEKPSYGDRFNARGGGVYAMEWTAALIRLWHFPRDRIPRDISSSSSRKKKNQRPNPSGWGKPDAVFGGEGCDVDTYFHRMRLVLNINFCGNYGSTTWGREEESGGGGGGGSCAAKKATSCADYVANNPAAFKEAFWEVNYIDAYQMMETNETVALTEESLSLGESGASVTSLVEEEWAPTGVPTLDTDTTTITSSADGGWNGDDALPSDMPDPANVMPMIPVESSSSDYSLPLGNIARIGDYSFLGCYGSVHDRFPGFELIGTNATAMTPEQCVAVCQPHVYAAVYDDSCYCADEIRGDVAVLVNPFECNMPCSGNPILACGGDAWTVDAGILTDPRTNIPILLDPLSRHVIAPDTLLTIYVRAPDMLILAAPGLGGPTGAQVITATSTVTYMAVCPSNNAQLVETSCVVTVTAECTFGETPAVPMTTQTIDCDGCGPMGEDLVRLTLPVEVPARIGSSTAGPTTSVARFAAAVAAAASPLHLWGVVGGVGVLAVVTLWW